MCGRTRLRSYENTHTLVRPDPINECRAGFEIVFSNRLLAHSRGDRPIFWAQDIIAGAHANQERVAYQEVCVRDELHSCVNLLIFRLESLQVSILSFRIQQLSGERIIAADQPEGE